MPYLMTAEPKIEAPGCIALRNELEVKDKCETHAKSTSHQRRACDSPTLCTYDQPMHCWDEGTKTSNEYDIRNFIPLVLWYQIEGDAHQERNDESYGKISDLQ